jgi:hypothetical protein
VFIAAPIVLFTGQDRLRRGEPTPPPAATKAGAPVGV